MKFLEGILEYNEVVETGLFIPLITGWIGGWMVNYLADVLPISRRFSQPTCPHCDSTYHWQDYLLFRACLSCGKGRTMRTWLVQLFGIASCIYIWMFPSAALGFVLGAILLVYFGMLMVIDFEHRLILHPTSAFGALLGLGIGTSIQMRIHGGLLAGLGFSILGGVAGFGIMFILYQFGTLVARWRSRKMQAAGQTPDDEEALGGGDVFLAGVLGLLLGWPTIVYCLILGMLLAGGYSLLLLTTQLIRRRYSSNAMMTFISYGPFFILSAVYFLYL
jgi:leader peptidase (prepilin peptidase)/N-methyltransferase